MIGNVSPVTHNLPWYSFLPQLTRLSVFKFGVMDTSPSYVKFFLNRAQNIASGYGFCSRKGDFDPVRAERMHAALLELGGVEHNIIPEDREGRLQVILLRAKALEEKIELLGGKWEKSGDRFVIRQPDDPTSEWNSFYQNSLKKIFPEERIDGNWVLVTASNMRNIPFENEEKTKCILFAGLGKSMFFRKFQIRYFLGKKLDLCLYDPRGIGNSIGYPSEGALYNGIRKVGDLLMESYDPKDICIFGSCGESFSAIHLFRQYHSRGINLILLNAPGSLQNAVSRTNRIAACLFSLSSKYIKAPEGSSCKMVEEDGFDSMRKISELPFSSKAGWVLLAKTIGDTLAPPQEIEEMAFLLRQKGNKVDVLTNRKEDSPSTNGLNDPHLSNPLKNPFLQHKIINTLFKTAQRDRDL